LERRDDPRTFERLDYVIGELIEEPETGEEGFNLLTRLAEYNALHHDRKSIKVHFSECFVWWYPRPFSYVQRQNAVETLLKSDQEAARLLAVSALVTATDVPRSLSGRGVVSRRLGREQNRALRREVDEFLEWATRRRLELAQSNDEALRSAASHEFENVIGPLAESLAGETAMRLIDAVLEKHFGGVVTLETHNLLGQLKWTRNRYAKNRDEGLQKWRASWNAFVARLDNWIEKLTTGPFRDRLKLALGPTFDHEEVEFEGRKLYTPDVRVIKLAREAIAKPREMDGVWELLVGDRTTNVYEFVRELGRRDALHQFHSEFLCRADTWQWAQLLGTYLSGAKEADPQWVEAQLAAMPLVRGESNLAALLAYRQTGFAAGNQSRLRALLRHRSVKPEHLAFAFSHGRWLEQLPPDQVRDVLEYIESGETITAQLAEVISLYLHPKKPLSNELFAIARRTLVAAQQVSDGRGNLAFHCDQIALGIAKSDLEEGFLLLVELLRTTQNEQAPMYYRGWSLLDKYAPRDFIKYLRDKAAERFYTILGKLDRRKEWPDLRGNRAGPLLDLEVHSNLLLQLAAGNAATAEVFADCLISSQPGFLAFVSKLLEVHPWAPRIHSSLALAVVERTGFGSAPDHLREAEEFLRDTLKEPDVSEVIRRWLDSVRTTIDDRRAEQQRLFGDDVIPE
jgi:hypothetical protein